MYAERVQLVLNCAASGDVIVFGGIIFILVDGRQMEA